MIRRGALVLFLLVAAFQSGCGSKRTEAQASPVSAWVDVRSAGAAGDGVSDDTAAVQRAIASLPSSGGTVYFPRGTYLVLQSQVIISNSHVRLEGAPGSVIRGMPGAWESAKLIQVQGTPGNHINDITITGLEFDGNQENHDLEQASQAHLLDIRNADRVVVSKNFFHDSPGDAIRIYPESTVCREVTVHQNKIDICFRNGISVVGGEYIDIIGNTISNFNTVGIDIEPNGNEVCRFIVVQGNTVRPAATQLNAQNSNRLYGISLKSATGPGDPHSDVRVMGNTVQGITEGTVRYPVVGIWLQKFKECTIAFNQVFDARQGVMTFYESPATNGATGEITGNHVRGCVNTGISVHSNMTVTGNTVEEGLDAGIFLGSINNVCIGNICRRNGKGPNSTQRWGIGVASGNNVVQGNQCIDDQKVKTQEYGIYLEDGVNEVTVEFNRLDGNRFGGIRQPDQGQNYIRLNTGNTPQNSGTARIDSGRVSTTVLHGLTVTPRDISIHAITTQPSNPPGAFAVPTITANSFTVTVERDPGPSGLDFVWEVNPGS